MSWERRSGPDRSIGTAPEDRTKIQDQGNTAEALAALVPRDAVVEVRILETRRTGTVAGYFDDLAALEREIRPWDGKAPGIYFTMNPVKPALLARSKNRLKPYFKQTTSDHDIERRCWLLVDIDPIRPAGICSTDDEHEAALECADKVTAYFDELGWPEPTQMYSGNGAYVLVPVDLPNDDPSRDLVERFLKHLAERFNDDQVKIDTSVHNAARIMRVPGTLNAKGDNTPERPHRQARLLHAPDHGEVVDADQLAAVIGDPDPEPSTKAARPGRFDLEQFIAEHLADNIASHGPWKGDGYRWVLTVCPFNPDHSRGEATIVRHPSGAIAASCRHKSCTWKWRDLRKKLDPDAYTRIRKGGARSTDDRFSDSVMAETVAEDILADRFIWTAGLGWLQWNGQRWIRCSDVTVGRVVHLWAMNRFAEAAAELAAGRTDEITVDGWKSLLQAHKQGAVLRLARGVVERAVEDLDADPDLLNMPAGVFDFRTGELLRHDPDLLMTHITRGSWRPEYAHKDWEAALEALPGSERHWLQTRVGQAATGHPTPDGVMPVLQGSGENGKSLVMTDGIVPTLGDYASMASAKLFQATKGSEHSTERADLRGRRALVAEELTEGRSIDVTALKQIQDVTTIKARYIRQDNIEFQASHSLFTTTNYVPIVNEVDHGTWRRLALVRFPYTFRKPGEELDADTDKRGDPELKARIRAGHDGQHDAIVTWIVEGARRWYADPARSLELTPTIAADTRAWRIEADRILGFWDEYMVPDRDACILTAETHDVFNDWLQANGHREWPKETFAPRFIQHQETARHRVTKARTLNPKGLSRPADPLSRRGTVPKRPEVYQGVRWRTVTDDQPDEEVPEVPDPSENQTTYVYKAGLPEGLAPLAQEPDQQEQEYPCPGCGAVVTYPSAGARWCSTCGHRWIPERAA
jgi:putative DNA primase/helicase